MFLIGLLIGMISVILAAILDIKNKVPIIMRPVCFYLLGAIPWMVAMALIVISLTKDIT